MSLLGQNINGIVYDADIKLKGIEVINRTQNKNTLTNDKGEFSIYAEVNDTLEFRSSFHSNDELKIQPIHFKGVMVIELEQFTNQLDQVLIYKTLEAKKFNVDEHNTNINDQIKADIKNHPYKYGLQSSTSLDFIAIVGLVSKLFKRKRRVNSVAYIKQEQIVDLFNTSDYFQDSLLVKELKISLKLKHLFLEYFSAQQVPLVYLESRNKFLLLDELITHSIAFNEILEDYQND